MFIPLLRSQILFRGYRDGLIIVLCFDTFHLGRSSSFLHLYISESPITAAQLVVRTPLVRTHHTDTRSAPLVARRRSNFLYLHASVSTLLPLPLLLVSLISYNCTLLLDHFTLVPASVSCHSHPVGAGRGETVHSLVRVFCPELTATSHQECNNHRNVLVGSWSYLFYLE